MQEETLRRHGVAHLEIGHLREVAAGSDRDRPGEGHDSEPSAHGGGRFALIKGKGKGKSKDHKEKGKANKEKGAHGKSGDTKEMECYHFGKKADLEKAKAEGRPAVPPQAVHAVTHDVGYPSSSSAGDEVRSSGGSAGMSVIRTAPGEVAYIWVLSAASTRNQQYPKGIMLDSGAAVNVCPADYFPEYGIQSGRRIELQAADGSPVEHYDSRESSQSIGCNEHDHFLVGGMARGLRIDRSASVATSRYCMRRTRGSSGTAAGSSTASVGRDGYTAFQGQDLQRRGVGPLRVRPVQGAVPGGGEAGRPFPPRCLGRQDLEERRPPDLRRR